MKRGMALRWEQVGEASGFSVFWRMGTGTGSRESSDQCGQGGTWAGQRRECAVDAFVKICFFQSRYPRVFRRGSRLLTAAAVEAAGGRGVSSSPSSQGGEDGVSCFLWNL